MCFEFFFWHLFYLQCTCSTYCLGNLAYKTELTAPLMNASISLSLSRSQISHSHTLMACFFGGASALAIFYACGVAITSNFSATTRAVVDINRAWLIWLFSIAIGWDTFDIRCQLTATPRVIYV
jgi:hypothetical protein